MTTQSYTDEQVQAQINWFRAAGDWKLETMLSSLLADRQRLQPDAERYRWLRDSHNGDLAAGREQDDGYVHILEGRHLDEAIDSARATPNETKEAKS